MRKKMNGVQLTYNINSKSKLDGSVLETVVNRHLATL